MSPMLEILIAQTARSDLLSIAAELSVMEKQVIAARLPAFARKARSFAGHWDFAAPSHAIDRLLVEVSPHRDPRGTAAFDRLRRAIVAQLVLDHFEVEDNLPSSVIGLYPEFFDRLIRFLSTKANYCYPQEYYEKDVRYALGLTVPCGAHQLDLRNRVGPKLVLRDVLASGSLSSAVAYVMCRGWGRWYANHLDLRAMKEFKPRGWTDSFVRMADALKLNPDVRGVAGVSWFHDPAVAGVSPHLGYILTPTLYGGFLANMGSAPHHVANATVRSSVRTKMHQEGKYTPTCYLLAWPRKALIAWAELVKSDPSAGFRDLRLGAQPSSPWPTPRTVAERERVDHPAASDSRGLLPNR
jgi:hypothetical protein